MTDSIDVTDQPDPPVVTEYQPDDLDTEEIAHAEPEAAIALDDERIVDLPDD